jgi:2-polyprenyl-3-methyl-5-hydroxy-6-metoxy-1,4-benzoquinol methylase
MTKEQHDESKARPKHQNASGSESNAGETAFLDRVSGTYVEDIPYHNIKRALIFEASKRFMRSGGGTALELGCHDGYETAMLSQIVDHLDVVEGSAAFIDKCKAMNLPNVAFIKTLFEDYCADGKYDYVFANYVFEHVLDPAVVLRMIKKALKPDGVLFVTVPNNKAFSRRLALEMGLLRSLEGLTENDVNHGHRRTYDFESAVAGLRNEGFEIVEKSGVIFKPLADFQLNQLLNKGFLTQAHIEALYRLGLKHPEMCDSIFLAARPDGRRF